MQNRLSCGTRCIFKKRLVHIFRVFAAKLDANGELAEFCDKLEGAARDTIEAGIAVGETVILLHPPLPLAGVSIAMER